MHQPIVILLVEGHPQVREGLARHLQRCPGVQYVLAAPTVVAAERLAPEGGVDLVLYDPRTVPGDAAEALHSLGREGRPVVVLTSSLREDEAHTLRKAGAAAVLFKGAERPALGIWIERASAARGSGGPAVGRASPSPGGR
jgi:DNA-binding NarL/FixJ family response regulator